MPKFRLESVINIAQNDLFKFLDPVMKHILQFTGRNCIQEIQNLIEKVVLSSKRVTDPLMSWFLKELKIGE
jgi:hypothetical protein